MWPFDKAPRRGAGPTPWQQQVEQLITQRRLGEAETLLREALATDPNNPWAQNKLGVTLALGQRREEAKAVLDKLVQEHATYAPAWINRGNLAFEEGALDQAQACYEKALALDPDAATAYHNLAAIAKRRGDVSAMVRYLKDSRRAERRRG